MQISKHTRGRIGKYLQIAHSASKSRKPAGLTADTITYTKYDVLNFTGSSSDKVISSPGFFECGVLIAVITEHNAHDC